MTRHEWRCDRCRKFVRPGVTRCRICVADAAADERDARDLDARLRRLDARLRSPHVDCDCPDCRPWTY